jgi:hypothetical protein
VLIPPIFFFFFPFFMKNLNKLGLLMAATLLLSSCKEESNEISPDLGGQTNTTSAGLRNAFANSLAKALNEEEVRDFLKTEALRKYDGDNDIVYSLVKDKVLPSGRTFEDILIKYSSKSENDSWLSKEPLMTILVPSIAAFNPNSWDIKSQIPDVAVDNRHMSNSDNKTEFDAFSADGTRYKVSATIEPTIPFIAIKENERMIVKNSSNKSAPGDLIARKSTKIVAQNQYYNFFFIGDYNPASEESAARTKSKKAEANRYASYYSLPAPLQNLQNNLSQIEQRDWIYYHILPASWNATEFLKGTFLKSYSEYVRSMKLASPAALSVVSDGWTEGALEFHVMNTFVLRGGAVDTDLKLIYCNAGDLMDGANNMLEFEPTNTELQPWDLERYGDEWKISLLEHDPGGSSNQTISAQSTFGTNFEANSSAGGLFLKVGVKFGATASFQKSGSTTVTISAEDDRLGDMRFLYDYPVVVSGAPNGPQGAYYYTKEISTGGVTLSIEPKLKPNEYDTRPPFD